MFCNLRVLLSLVAPLLCQAGTFAVAAGEAKPSRPNLIIIMADDMGFSDLGCYGGEIQTPNLDRLAAGGLRFSQFYNTGRCWPTRASLMTGLYPHQARKAMTFGEKAPPAYSGLVPEYCRMIPELLAGQGYRNYHVGKWHLNSRGGGPNKTWPLGRGFDHSYYMVTQNNYFSPRLVYDDDEKITRPGGDYYTTRVLSERAVGVLKDHAKNHQKDPFFLYLAYTAPHFPLHALAEDVALYRGKYRGGWDTLRDQRQARLKELGLLDCELSPRDSDAGPWESLSDLEKDLWDRRMAIYAAMIHRIDLGIGDVVRQLREMGSLDNTLIVFLSDNGSSAEYLVRGDGHQPGSAAGSKESYQCLEVGWANASNTPFRFHKMWTHEGGISTPLIVHWPRGLKGKGQISRQVGHVIDLLPTLIEAAGASYPKSHAGHATFDLPGRSLMPVFQGKQRAAPEFLFWEHVGNKAIRQGDWKLVAEHQGDWELYDLKEDRSELRDLAKNHPAMVKELAEKWQAYADQIGVVPWESLPQSRVKPSSEYRRK